MLMSALDAVDRSGVELQPADWDTPISLEPYQCKLSTIALSRHMLIAKPSWSLLLAELHLVHRGLQYLKQRNMSKDHMFCI